MSIEQELVHIVDKSLQKIIGEFDSVDLIQRLVSQHLHDVIIENSITLRVHSDVSDEVRHKFSSIPELERYLNIIPDQSLDSVDGFVLDTPSGRIESGISMQIKMLVDSFKKNF